MNEYFMEALRQDIDTIKKQLARQSALTEELVKAIRALTPTASAKSKKEGV